MLATKEFNVKKSDFWEWYNSIIYAADLVDNRYNLQGFLVHKPAGAFMIKRITELLEEGLNKTGHEEVLFPIGIPKENFELEKEHVEGFAPELFWITKMGDKDLPRPFALRPTSETAFYQMYSLWIRSHNDLPLKYYQAGTVYRAEKETSPFLRGREFYWIETHCAFQTKKEALKQVKEDQKVFGKVLKTYLGLNYMVFDRPEWDKFAGAEKTIAFDTLLPDGKVLQVGSTHYLGQKFSKPFNIKADNEFVYQTCFGHGVWRVVAAVVAIHGDDKGLKVPSQISKIQVAIVPVGKNDKTQVFKDVKKQLKSFRVQIFDDIDKSFGFKLNQTELLGIPVRVEVGDRELEAGQATIFDRFTGNKKQVSLVSLKKEVANLFKEQEANFKNLKDLPVYQIDSISDLKEGGIARAYFIGTKGTEAEQAAKDLQEKTNGVKVRGTLFGVKETVPEGAKCFMTGKPAKCVVYLAKQY
ncbi:Proline--tRNA ligase [uncultured archaeon]|nr:Proline--tRNA ligase [uncultured archaeon]